MKLLNRHVTTIFIMLGNSCNMNCVYCLQHPLVHKAIAKDINKDIYQFIAQTVEDNDGRSLQLQFYGGEPLVYYDKIKEIVATVKEMKIPHIRFSIITNGRAITDETVEFFNSNNFNVAISWDGKNVLQTRGYDSFSPFTPLRRRIMRINNLCISSVMSSKAYPIEILEGQQELDDQYFKLTGNHIMSNIDLIFDTGLPDKGLLYFDDKRLKKEMVELLDYYFDHGQDKKFDLKVNWIGQMLQRLNYFYGKDQNNGRYAAEICACSNGYSTLNLDLAGNLYTCHNVSSPVGTIYSSYYRYMAEIVRGDPTKRHQEECANCPAVYQCMGGCKLVSDEARKETYCHLRRIVYGTIIGVLQAYGETL